ncbi:MAG: ribbon-helix-helix domain-containing protein [Chloroflexi bacterium]|nr:ribbon-helix-helix domain-containing protein [Chloroflexota bacterium]
MGRTTKTITISLPPEMHAQVEEAMAEEGRTKSELLREALRRYFAAREGRRLQVYAIIKAKEKGITEDQIEDIVDAYRK